MINIVDFLKVFFAVCIVGIHTNVLKMFNPSVNWYISSLVFRLGVPFFFITSGYFLGIKIQKAKELVEVRSLCVEYAKKNFPPFLFWSILGLFYKGFFLVHNHESAIFLKLLQTAVFYPLGAMWFLSAAIFAVLLVGCLWEHKTILILLGLGGYCFTLLCNTYYFVVQDVWLGRVIDVYMKIFLTGRNFIGVGVIFIGLGIWLASDSCFFKKLKTRYLLLVLFFLEAGFIYEVWYTFGRSALDDSSCFVCLPFLAIIILSLALRIKAPYSMERSIQLRRFSANLYFLHPPVNSWIGNLILILTGNYFLRFVFVMLICILVYFFTKNQKNKYLRAVLP